MIFSPNAQYVADYKILNRNSPASSGTTLSRPALSRPVLVS